ncbi:MAG: polysaccharide biosynthesis C-terminal domain-containing protein, partial [Pseudomonadota bacterium]
IASINLSQAVWVWTGAAGVVTLAMAVAYPFTRANRAPNLRTHVSEWVRVGLVIMLTATGAAMMERIDILILGSFRDAEEVAVYSIASRVALIGAIAINAAAAAFGPGLAVAVSARNGETAGPIARRAALLPTVALLGFCACLALFGREVLALFGDAFRDGWVILMILAFAQLGVATFGSNGGIVVFAGAEGKVVRSILIGLAANLLLNLALVPQFGGTGAAIGSMSSLLLIQILLAVWSRQNLDHPTDIWPWRARGG